LGDWDFLFGVNVRTTLLCCRAVIPQMLRQGHGRIVNVASRDGLHGSAGYSAYSASKSAVLRLTESMAAELKSSNINVNCIMPALLTPRKTAKPFLTLISPNGSRPKRLRMSSCSSSRMPHVPSTAQRYPFMERAENGGETIASISYSDLHEEPIPRSDSPSCISLCLPLAVLAASQPKVGDKARDFSLRTLDESIGAVE